jgi:tetratricopeptide (TPR) repeat protein
LILRLFGIVALLVAFTAIGTQAAAAAPASCEYAATLDGVGERAAAHTAYLKVLEAEPSSLCARAGVSRTASTTSIWSWLSTAAANAGKAAAAVVLGALLIAVVVLVLLQIQTRIPGLRDIWPASRIRRPTLQIASLDDAALSEHLGASVAGLVRGRVSWQRDRFGVNLVSGQAGVATALSGLGEVSSEAKAAVAVIDFLTAVLPRRRFVLAGELQPPGAEGRGISLELSQQTGYEALITFWAGSLVIPDDAPAAKAYGTLAVAAAAWVDHWMVRILGKGDLLTNDPQSWAVFRCGLDAQRLGEEKRARALYDRALVMDGTNVGAMANLGIIYRRSNEWEDALRNLASALGATENRDVAPKLKAELNPDWYRIKYQLAALYTNWAAATSAGVQHDDLAAKARSESTGLALSTLKAIEKPPTAGLGESVPADYVGGTLLPFLKGTIEPSALVLVALAAEPVPPAPPQGSDGRPGRRALIEVLEAETIDPWPLVAYVEKGEHLTPSAHFDLACFYANAGAYAKATERLQRAIRETAPPERMVLIDVAKRDPTLDSLRDVRPGLIPKFARDFAQVRLDPEEARLVEEFDLQSRVYEKLVDAGWSVTWEQPLSPFSFRAQRDGEILLVVQTSGHEPFTMAKLNEVIGLRTTFAEDAAKDGIASTVGVLLMLHPDARQECDVDEARQRGVDIQRLS